MNRKLFSLILYFLFASSAICEPVRIVAFGDSLTQGYGVVPEAGFVPQLEQWLFAQGANVAVTNAGLSGDTTAGAVARIEWTLEQKFDAIIVALGANDILRGIDPSTSKQNLSKILQVAKSLDVEILLIGMLAPLNYGVDYKRQFDAIYAELAEDYGTLLLDNFFVGMTDSENNPAKVRDLMQSDGLHPNAAGVKKIVEGIGPSVLELITLAQK
ncbi:MAG: arylesterase [Aestuariivita sp.]|nr:arylesterase [Aestuariivita sp.]